MCVTGGVVVTTVVIAEAVDGEGADHPEIVDYPHPVIEVAATMTVTVTNTVVDTTVLQRLVVVYLPLVVFILVLMAMGITLLPLTVPVGVLMDLLRQEDQVDLVRPLPVEVVVMVDPQVHLVHLELVSLNLHILYLHKVHHQRVALVDPEQTVVVPPAHLVPQEAWGPLPEKDIQVVHLLPVPLHLEEI